MDLDKIKALTFDTGGTVLDWHRGFSTALAALGAKLGVTRDWPALTNDLRRRSLTKMVNLGEHEPPAYNFDGGHRMALDEVLAENGMDAARPEDRRKIWWDAAHNLEAWPDFPAVLPLLRERFICASFTLLSVRMIVDTSRRNGLQWDAVLSCELIGKYKILPEAYLGAAAALQLQPAECLMVACHNFDLDAAKSAGFKTAFMARPDEWGPEGPPDPVPSPDHDIVAKSFPELARKLGVRV